MLERVLCVAHCTPFHFEIATPPFRLAKTPLSIFALRKGAVSQTMSQPLSVNAILLLQQFHHKFRDIRIVGNLPVELLCAVPQRQ